MQWVEGVLFSKFLHQIYFVCHNYEACVAIISIRTKKIKGQMVSSLLIFLNSNWKITLLRQKDERLFML